MRRFAQINTDEILNEIRALNILCAVPQCPYLIHVFDHGWVPGTDIYFVDMERASGNLAMYIREVHSLENKNYPHLWFAEDGLRMLWDVSIGLRFIHDKGIVHRDMKPANGTLKSV